MEVPIILGLSAGNSLYLAGFQRFVLATQTAMGGSPSELWVCSTLDAAGKLK